jgi:hypothetical protein
MIDAIGALDLNLPASTPKQQAALAAARRQLQSEPD